MGAFVDLMSSLIHVLYQFTEKIGFPSYALAIVLIGVIVRVLLFPLSLKQMKSMLGMSEIQPELQELQKRYRNNPQKMQEEMKRLYEEYEVNPAAGCLPILIQMPILWAIFRAMRTYDYNENASFFWIHSLKEADPYYILPVILVVLMFFQQKLSMSKEAVATNPSMKVMLYVMPLMMGFFMVSLPSGVGVYWMTTSALMLVQQVIMNKQREKEKAARAELRAQREKEREKLKKTQKNIGQNKNKKKERIAKAKARKKGNGTPEAFDVNNPKATYQPKKK